MIIQTDISIYHLGPIGNGTGTGFIPELNRRIPGSETPIRVVREIHISSWKIISEPSSVCYGPRRIKGICMPLRIDDRSRRSCCFIEMDKKLGARKIWIMPRLADRSRSSILSSTCPIIGTSDPLIGDNARSPDTAEICGRSYCGIYPARCTADTIDR